MAEGAAARIAMMEMMCFIFVLYFVFYICRFVSLESSDFSDDRADDEQYSLELNHTMVGRPAS